jgi:peptidyl-prolyl cis-trans isomerase D
LPAISFFMGLSATPGPVAAGEDWRSALGSAGRDLYVRLAGAARSAGTFFRAEGFFMLDRLRQGIRGWTAKILLGLLVLSFAVWGISGEFFGYGAGRVAEVGSTEVTTAEFDRALRNRMQTIGQQMGRGLTMEQARAMGLPQQVLGELVSDAALQDQARDYNIGISEERLAQTIAADPTFHGFGGQFDRMRFQTLLRNAGMNENMYIQDIRRQLMRQQLASAVAGGLTAPKPLVEALYKYQNESRTISYVVIDENAIEPVGEPDAEQLAQYFEANRARFRAPEYRRLGVIVLDRERLADPATVSDEAVREAYEARQDEFAQPERRRIEQIRFPDREAAEEAMRLLEDGGDFLEIAQSRGLSAADVDLGLRRRAEIVDPVVAEAAFAAEEGEVVAALDARLGPALVRVTAVEEGAVQEFEQVAPRLRQQIAERQARDRVIDLYDRLEDERAGGLTLEEAAQELGLEYRILEVAEDGTTPEGGMVEDLPGREEVIEDAFLSDVGLENNPIRAGEDSFVFYEVQEIAPDRDRTLEEARDRVAAAWRTEATARRVAERADQLMERLEGGADLRAIAEEIGTEVRTAEGVTRIGNNAGLSRNAVAQAFAGPRGHVANAEADERPARMLLRVDNVVTPAFFAESQDAEGLETALGRAMRSDILQAYAAHLMQTRSTSVNSAAFAQLTGQSQ